jgi:hypothetical protein
MLLPLTQQCVVRVVLHENVPSYMFPVTFSSFVDVLAA